MSSKPGSKTTTGATHSKKVADTKPKMSGPSVSKPAGKPVSNKPTTSTGKTATAAKTTKKSPRTSTDKQPAASSKNDNKVAAKDVKTTKSKTIGITIPFKKLATVIFDPAERQTIVESGRWPLLIDSGSLCSAFLRHRDTNYINAVDPSNMVVERLRMSLMGAIRFGKPFILDLMESNELYFDSCKSRFDEISPGLLGKLEDKSLLKDDGYTCLTRPTDDQEYSMDRHWNVEEFQFIVLTNNGTPDDRLMNIFYYVIADPNLKE